MKTIILTLLISISILGQSSKLHKLGILFNSEDVYTIENFELQRYADALTVPLSDEQLERLDILITMLKDSASVDSLPLMADYLLIMANETSEAALTNLIKRKDDATIGAETVTFTQWEGFTGDGITGYINTNFNASTDAVVYAQNSASFAIYFRSGGNFGYHGNNLHTMTSLGNSSAFNRSWINAGGFQTPALTWAVGFKITTRLNASQTYMYINGAGPNYLNETSSALSNSSFYLCAYNNAVLPTSFATSQISIVMLGKYFDLTTHNKIKNCFEWYMDDLGKGVIP